jgi:invasion protein IalB
MKVLPISVHLSALLAALLSAAASAQTPERTTATYDQWTLRCETIGEDERACEVFQTVVIQGSSTPVAQIAFAPQVEGGQRLIVQSPISVWLPAGVRFSLAEEEILTAEFKRCFPNFCLAEADLPDATLERLRAQNGEGTLIFQDGGEREVTVPLSFDGFADAYTALLAELGEPTEGEGQ